MAISEYIESELLEPVYQNKIPHIVSPSIEAICRELYYAIKAKEPIFVYGDYDTDGFCSGQVWDEVLSSIYQVPVQHFRYGRRMHTLDRDIVDQVRISAARIVIVCDTGSSKEDREVLSLLRLLGKTPIVIDHHVWAGDYESDTRDMLVFNSHEERELLKGHEVSGAYASLLVANHLCEHWLKHPLSYNACVYALASMYSDVVDLATPPGRALYNYVSFVNTGLPALLQALNTWDYTLCKRVFSFIIGPQLNACFRTEQFGPLNRAAITRDKYGVKQVADAFREVHSESTRLVAMLTPMFTREQIGDITLCIHHATDETRALHVRSFTGLIANRIASETHSMVLTLIKDGGVYAGSFRDFYNREMLDTFKLFCKADGHDTAFGLEFYNISEFRRHLAPLATTLVQEARKDYSVLSSSLVGTDVDVQVLALYNEYMNVRPRLLLTHRCRYLRTISSTKFSRFYDVGLPYTIRSNAPLYEGANILIEPTISKKVELRCVE